MRSHWAFRRLSELLVSEGCHVLRFDYFGTGDSAGNCEEARLLNWVDDICTAYLELKEISGAREITLVGLRFGAVLAAKASVKNIKVKELILWDPVVNGKDYINGLKRMQEKLLVKFNIFILI